MFLLAQLGWDGIAAFVMIGFTIVGTGVAVGVRVGKVEGKVDSLDKKLEDLAAGKGPICAQHAEMITTLRRQVDRHEDLLNPSMPRPACEDG